MANTPQKQSMGASRLPKNLSMAATPEVGEYCDGVKSGKWDFPPGNTYLF